MASQHELIITGARQNNLKNISLRIPHDQITVITGVSGSGKSSLAFDTIFAEGQWRYIESRDTKAQIIQGCRSEAAEAEARRRVLASEGDAGVPFAVRRGGRARRLPPGERIGRCSRYSWIVRAKSAHVPGETRPACPAEGKSVLRVRREKAETFRPSRRGGKRGAYTPFPFSSESEMAIDFQEATY
jgi:hypothetical protein